jgi:hypothetical protein
MLAFALPGFIVVGPDFQRFYASLLLGKAALRALPPDIYICREKRSGTERAWERTILLAHPAAWDQLLTRAHGYWKVLGRDG